MRTLRHAIPGLLGFEPGPDSPEPGEEEGLLAACSGAAWDGEHLRFDLKLAWAFSSRYVSTFGSLSDAIVLVAEDAGGGSAFALRTIDPHKKYLPRPAPNWSGPPPPAPPPPAAPDRPIEEPLTDEAEEQAEATPQPDAGAGQPALTGSETGWIGVPCEMAVGPPAWPGPSVFVTARLHGHASNTVALELAPEGVKSTSYLWSRAWEPARHSPGAPPAGAPRPPPGQPALALAQRAASPGGPKVLEATLRLTAEDLAAGGPEAWLRSVFICAVLRGDQLPLVTDWLGDRLALKDDLVVAPEGGEARLAFDLGHAFAERLAPGVYDVQVSARQHRSQILEVTIP